LPHQVQAGDNAELAVAVGKKRKLETGPQPLVSDICHGDIVVADASRDRLDFAA
jgi:hypothetical protein